jgi:hypothetical protein
VSPGAALVLEHEADAPAGLLADWATERGIALEVFAWHEDGGAAHAEPTVDGRPFVVTLG